MTPWSDIIPQVLWDTARDVLPMVAVLFGFQHWVLRQPIPRPGRVIAGFVLVWIGLALFFVGVEKALVPLGQLMVEQITSPGFLGLDELTTRWQDYLWVYAFAAAIGFSTTIPEPALIGIAYKAEQVSGGVIGQWGLRVAVALGVAIGIALGCFRIVTGTPLPYYIITGYVVVLIQTAYAPRPIIALAYDTGGVTTSTVSVPMIAALGLGLSAQIPGRSPVLDGFGLIAFGSLFPMMTVMGYAQVGEWLAHRRRKKKAS